LSENIKRPQVVIDYNFVEGITNEEEVWLALSVDLFSIGVIT
jgi:hypothetical protein